MQSIKHGKKALFVFFFTFIAACAMMLLVFADSAKAAELGDETPYLYCTYFDENGEEVNGNKLSPGTYEVNFNISGVSAISTLQVTAEYDTEKVTAERTPLRLMSDSKENAVSSMGEVIENGNIVFGFVSDNADSSPVNSEGTLVAGVKMTFSEPCDASDVISFDANPNLTFAQVSYEDGFDDEYALDDMYPDYNGSLYLMSADISPSGAAGAFDVSGQIKIATDVTGSETTVGIVGINVSVEDSSGSTIASAVTDNDGYYTLTGLPEGEYKMIVSGPTTIDREVTLIVSESKKVAPIGIVICDYNKDNFVNSTDNITFSSALAGQYDIYCDINGDTFVNSSDNIIVSSLLNKSITYENVTLR